MLSQEIFTRNPRVQFTVRSVDRGSLMWTERSMNIKQGTIGLFASCSSCGSYEYVPSQMRIISKSALLLGLSFLLIGIGIAVRQHHWYSISSLCHLSTELSFELNFNLCYPERK